MQRNMLQIEAFLEEGPGEGNTMRPMLSTMKCGGGFSINFTNKSVPSSVTACLCGSQRRILHDSCRIMLQLTMELTLHYAIDSFAIHFIIMFLLYYSNNFLYLIIYTRQFCFFVLFCIFWSDCACIKEVRFIHTHLHLRHWLERVQCTCHQTWASFDFAKRRHPTWMQ